MFEILDSVNCSDGMKILINTIQFVLNLIRWAIPILLIILGSIDMFKAMASGDDKEAEKGKKTFIRRLIYAVVAFLIPFAITLVFDVISGIVVDKNNKTIDSLDNEELTQGKFFDCWYKKDKNNDPTPSSNEEEQTEEQNNPPLECLCYSFDDNGNTVGTKWMAISECYAKKVLKPGGYSYDCR